MFIEMIGWTADIFFLTAYLLVSQGRIDGKSATFNGMNLAGAGLYGVYAIIRSTLPILILECFWGFIAIAALWKAYKTRRAP